MIFRYTIGNTLENVLLLSLHFFFLRNGVDKVCLLRSVCDTAENPIHNSGLIGEFIQMILTYVFSKICIHIV